MTVSEGLMTVGSWSLKLRPETPWATVQALGDNLLDHLVVTPVRIQSPSRSTLLAAARYVGRVDTWDPGDVGDNAQIGGPGIATWMGDGDDKGKFFGYVILIDTFSVFLTTYFTAANTNGLTLGTRTGLSGNTIVWSCPEWRTMRKCVDELRLMTTTETEWRVNVDGSVDFAAAGNSAIFAQTPTVVISKDGQDFESDFTLLQAEQLRYSRDKSTFATEVDVYEDSDITFTGSSSRSKPKGFDGSTDANLQKRETTKSTSGTNKNNQAAAALGGYDTKYRFDVAVNVDDIGAHLIAGDYVYLWNPSNKLRDTANSVKAAGRVIHPVKVRCVGVQWPVTAGMGVYRLATQGGSNTVTDLTDYVVSETGATKLTIGDLPPRLGVQVGR